MARPKYYYDPGEDLDMPEYEGPDTGTQRGWGAGLSGVGTSGMGLAGGMALTGNLPAAGITAGASALAMLGGYLLGGNADEQEQEAQEEYDKEMLAYQKEYSEKEMAFREKEAMRAAKRDALMALKSRNIYV